MHVDIADLHLFLQIVEAGSITGGAERAYLALASASARIRRLEQALGVTLLVRESRGVRPTAAGWTLVHHARLLLQQMDRLHGELGDYAQGLRGEIRLLSNTAALTERLPTVLSDFLACHPTVDISLEERPSHEIVRSIAEGAADIGLVADAVDLSGLETFPFGEDRLVLVAARDHPLAARRTIDFSETLDQIFVGLGAGSALQAYLTAQAARLGRRLTYRVQLHSFEAICRLVERNIGVGIVPATAAIRCQRTMAIRRVRLRDAWATRQLTICVRRYDELPGYAQQLVAAIRA